MADEILNLSTIVKRPTINIESRRHPKGKLYELINLADLGPYEYAYVLERNEELEPLRKVAKPTEAQKRQLEQMLSDVVRMLVPSLEPSVLAALTDQQKEMIVVAWAAHVQSSNGAAEGNRQSRRTTAASSRGSRRSTAATPKRGSTPRRGR